VLVTPANWYLLIVTPQRPRQHSVGSATQPKSFEYVLQLDRFFAQKILS
jgi:hypothetical protein